MKTLLLFLMLLVGCGDSLPSQPYINNRERSFPNKEFLAGLKVREYSNTGFTFKKVQILVSGLTYENGRYWDPIQSEMPNYISWAMHNNLEYDFVVLDMSAWTLSNYVNSNSTNISSIIIGLIDEEYAYEYAIRKNQQIVCIGHSAGALELVNVARTDVCDKLIVTGAITTYHPFPPIPLEIVNNLLSMNFPRIPGDIRKKLFYVDSIDPNIANIDNNMIATRTLNKRLKDSLTVFTTPNNFQWQVGGVIIPVFILAAKQDPLFPSELLEKEIKEWKNTSVKTYEVLGGHSLNFHPSAIEGWKAFNDWLK